MNQMRAKSFLLCFLLLGSPLCLAQQEPQLVPDGVVLSSGGEGGGYWSAGNRLQAVALKELGLTVKNVPSAGSLENLARLLDDSSPVNLAFAQADALQLYLSKQPDEVKKLDLLENIGQECVFIITGTDSKLLNDEDVQGAAGLRLGIPSATSGIAVTFEYMVSQMPELADVEVIYGDTLNQVEGLGTDDATVDAVMMVHRPREQSAEVSYALENPDRVRFVAVSDKRFIEETWNGRRVYRSMSLAMPGIEEPVNTICVTGLLVLNKQKLTLEQRNQLSDLANYHWMKVYAIE